MGSEMCIRDSREVLEHGIETGVIKQMPNGAFIEVHQPLGPVDADGHPVPLDYAGAQVPKQLNQLGLADSETQGTFSPDDEALMHRVHEIHSDNHDEEAEMFRRLNEANRREDEENGRI